MEDELTGDGMLILDGGITATVYYWLTVVPEPGAVIAEGSVSRPLRSPIEWGRIGERSQ
jgi:hypothetical protein